MPKKKKAARSTGAKARAAGDKSLDSAQRDLPGVESDRIPQIETIIKKIVDKTSQRSALKDESNALRDRLVPIFEKHKLTQYSCHGKTVVIEPGGVIVRIKNAKAS